MLIELQLIAIFIIDYLSYYFIDRSALGDIENASTIPGAQGNVFEIFFVFVLNNRLVE